MIKQRGAMFAKGRLLGIQFDCLFTDDIYFKINAKAVEYALQIKRAFIRKGIRSYGPSMTNQQFVLLNKEQQEYFAKNYVTDYFDRYDDEYDIIRFCTSWATQEENVKTLLKDIEAL